MILTRCFLTLLGIVALQCEGAECISRIKRQAREYELDIASCNLADVDADRPARCVSSPFRRFKNRVDGELIAKYFSDNGLAGFGGSLLGSQKPQTDESKTGMGDADLSSIVENVQSSAETIPDSVVGAPNSFNGANSMIGQGQLVASNPLLKAAAAWLQPQTLLAMRNGMQVTGRQGIVGYQDPSSISSSRSIKNIDEMDSMPTNMVGSPHQNTAGNSRSMGTIDLYAYPTAAITGITPYSYVVGAPNPIYVQDQSDVPLMQPYLYSYDSITGTQNPSYMGGNYVGSSPYWDCLSSAGAPSNQKLHESSVSVDKGLDGSSQIVEDVIGQPNPDPSLDLEQGTDVHSEAEFKTMENEDESGVVGSKRAVNLQEGKDQTVDSSSHSTKQRQNKYKPKKTTIRPKSMVEDQHVQATNGAD